MIGIYPIIPIDGQRGCTFIFWAWARYVTITSIRINIDIIMPIYSLSKYTYSLKGVRTLECDDENIMS
jgi:hypothetical protein